MASRIGRLRDKYFTMEMLLAISEELHNDSRNWNTYLRKQWEEFDSNYETNISDLRKELRSMTYKHGEYYIFRKEERGKMRVIYSSSPRDRIVDKLLSVILEDIFLPKLERNVFGSIKGKGQHRCRELAKRAIERTKDAFVATSDIKQYYPTCNVNNIINIVSRHVKCRYVIWLLTEMLSINEVVLGNISSNIIGHINMLDIDRMMIREYKFKHYYRFCDDMIIVDSDKNYLHSGMREYIGLVAENGQTVKRTWAVFPVAKRRADFLGLMIGDSNTRLRKSSRRRIENEIKKRQYDSEESISRYWAGVNGALKGSDVSNLLKYWNNEYPEFFKRLRQRKAASIASYEQKRKHRRMEAKLRTARDCRIPENRSRYPFGSG